MPKADPVQAPECRIFGKFLAIALLSMAISPALTRADDNAIKWQPWSDQIFTQAKKENRFVLLDLGAGWCHWCHVMDEETYRDPKVTSLIRSKYLAVQVDQDSRPDLANRYEDYGWPATIIFGPDGKEIVKRRGYIPPGPMASLLQAIIDDPTPGPSVSKEEPVIASAQSSLPPEQVQALRQKILSSYDPKKLGWGTGQKFLDWDIIEYCLAETAQGEKEGLEKMARETLGAQLNLIDPVWGGVCQYSTDGDWKHPHFEKLAQFQAENLRIFAIAYARWGDPSYLQTAEKIHQYIQDFLTSPEGAFYTSQDADLVPGEHSADYFDLNDKERRKRGLPRVDTHIYARENGWVISALTVLYSVTGKTTYLDEAKRAAAWILEHRALPGGGFSHGEKDSSGPYLGDSLAMGRAFLALYAVTADRSWLNHASETADFINGKFKAKAGFMTSIGNLPFPERAQLDENVATVCFTNLLNQYTGNDRYKEMSDHAMRYLATPHLTDERGFQVAGILLANQENSVPPLHITIVGSKADPAAQTLFLTAIKLAPSYKRVEWWDQKEGPLPDPSVTYPPLSKAAAFLCTERSCSMPIYSPEKLKVK